MMSEYNTNNQSHFINDECYINQQNKSNKSIFSYITDTTMFINKNQCLDTTPTFLSYTPIGIPTQNIDIESNLRGASRNNTRCASCKYQPDNLELTGNGKDNNIVLDLSPNNRHLCNKEYQILPDGYYNNSTRK